MTRFDATPKMSTFSIVLVISEISCESGENIDNILPFQVCSRDKVADDRALSVGKGADVIKLLEDYTGIQYSNLNVGKLDFFSLPRHFTEADGSWGLITFR